MAGLFSTSGMRGDSFPEDNRGSFWIGFAVLTLISAGTGSLLATHLMDFARSEADKRPAEVASSQNPDVFDFQTARLRELKPLVTNLAAPRDAWVRVTASVVLADKPIEDVSVLTGRIEEDMLAYLRTLTISHIEGAAGLQHLREDLNERAIARSRGAVREVILESLVIQ